MLIRWLKYLIWGTGVLCLGLFLSPTALTRFIPGQEPLYLSFDQRFALAQLTEMVGKTPQQKIDQLSRYWKYVEAKAAQPVETVTVSSFDDFLRLDRGSWPDTHLLSKDIELIESSVKPPVLIVGHNREMQALINSYRKRQLDYIREVLAAGAKAPVADSILSAMQKQDFVQLRQLLMANHGVLEDAFEYQLREVREIGAEMSNQLKGTQGSEGFVMLLSQILRQYYTRLGLSSKKQIFSQILGADLNADGVEKFSIMVQNSGPQFQKLLQVISRDFKANAQLTRVFKQLESSVRPVPPVLVREIMEKERANYKWISYELTPMGVGTMAQIHRGEIATEQGIQSVAIRFIKPGIDKRVEEDRRILSEIAPILDQDPKFKAAGMPTLSPLVDDLTKSVMDEVLLGKTMAMQIAGKEHYQQKLFYNDGVYKTDLAVNVPSVIVKGNTQLVMVQDMSKGMPLDQLVEEWKDILPHLKTQIAEQITTMWLEEVLFRSGFYHSDLHQGNFLVSLTADQIQVDILDFGMSGYIQKPTRELLLLLSIGLEALDAQMVTNALWELSRKDKNTITREKLLDGVVQRMNKVKRLEIAEPTTGQWTSWAMEKGMRFPEEFIGVNRGLIILERLLLESGSKLNCYKIGKTLTIRHGKQTLETLRGERGRLTWSEVLKLGYKALNRPFVLPEGKACQMAFSY